MESEVTNMIAEETLSTLMIDKKDCELKAFELGAAQAAKLIDENPSYEFLSMLADFSQNWFGDSEEPVDVNFIDTDTLPTSLTVYIITGFYSAILDIKKSLAEAQP